MDSNLLFNGRSPDTNSKSNRQIKNSKMPGNIVEKGSGQRKRRNQLPGK